jgi:hypothetical protein
MTLIGMERQFVRDVFIGRPAHQKAAMLERVGGPIKIRTVAGCFVFRYEGRSHTCKTFIDAFNLAYGLIERSLFRILSVN